MEQVSSFIVHIYQHTVTGTKSQQRSEIIGVVEEVESEVKTPFKTPQQLWKILSDSDSESSLNIVRHKQGEPLS